jgi:hypothetical protein
MNKKKKEQKNKKEQTNYGQTRQKQDAIKKKKGSKKHQ